MYTFLLPESIIPWFQQLTYTQFNFSDRICNGTKRFQTIISHLNVLIRTRYV